MTTVMWVAVIIWLIAAVVYTTCSIREEKARRKWERNCMKTVEVLELIGKLWENAESDQDKQKGK